MVIPRLDMDTGIVSLVSRQGLNITERYDESTGTYKYSDGISSKTTTVKFPLSTNDILRRYTHYKGNEYTVIGVGANTDDPEGLLSVIYVDGSHSFMWSRSLLEFFSTVKKKDDVIHRFT